MNLTKKVIAGVLIAGFLATFLALPKAAEAGGGYGHGHGTTATAQRPSGAGSRSGR